MSDINIKIVQDQEAKSLIDNIDFIDLWETIAKNLDKVTVQQEPPFVITWYKSYLEVYIPAFILGYDKNSDIIGIIPLAISKDNGDLFFAGSWQAEYRGWICKEDFEDRFIIQALIAIKNEFELKQWNWGWLSPNSLIDWFKTPSLDKHGIYVKSQQQDSPILDVLNEERINKLKKNKSIKNQINRYKKRGDFFLERIKSKEQAAKIFDQLALFCDFRQMGINKSSPFLEDNHKKPFHLARLDYAESCHFSVLWSNDKPIAYNFGECDEDTVYLGVLSFDPQEAKNSPGKIMLIYLAELMKEEGFRYLDLTPGRSTYKERMGNTSRTVHHLTVFFNKKIYLADKYKYLFKDGVKSTFNFFKIDNEKIVNNLKSLKPNNPKLLLQRFNSESSYYYYQFSPKLEISDVAKPSFEKKYLFQKNNYESLLINANSNQQHISNALKSFLLEDNMYTITSDEELNAFAWLTENLRFQNNAEIDSYFEFPANSAIIYGLTIFESTNENQLTEQLIYHIINDCKKRNIDHVFFDVSNHNSSLISLVKRLKFEAYQQVKIKHVFWKKSVQLNRDPAIKD